MPIQQLLPEQLRLACDPQQFAFETTVELDAAVQIIGQPRAVKALEFGLGIRSHGYNLFVIGETGQVHINTIETFVRERAAKQSRPKDWLYLHNFANPFHPLAISLPTGDGATFKGDMKALIDALKEELPDVLDGDEYREAAEKIRQTFREGRDNLIQALRDRAQEDGLTMIRVSSGYMMAPLVEGKAMPMEDYQKLPVDEHQAWEKKRQAWDKDLDDTLREIQLLDKETRDNIKQLNRDTAVALIDQKFDQMREKYAEHEILGSYFDAVYEDVLEHLKDFSEVPEDDEGKTKELDLHRYEVNLFLDNSVKEGEWNGAPVIVERDPRLQNLMGRVEFDSHSGPANFTHIIPGSLHRANGGYLIVLARDLNASRHNSWDALKRSLKTKEIKLQSPERADSNQVQAKSIDPRGIPLDVKVIILGHGNYFYRYYHTDEDFRQLFKAKAEFNWYLPRTPEHIAGYATFVATLCQDESLLPFDRTAVAELITQAARWCEHQERLSASFDDLATVVREASFWAGLNGRETVTACDVKQAIRESEQRVSLDQEHSLNAIRRGNVYLTTRGEVVGQVNGLSIIDYGDHSFGVPGRITARTYQGEQGIINIDREVELTGAIHDKGLLTLIGYLGGMYAQERPLTLSASLTFEQNYGRIDGDSASSTELYALLSRLADVPIKQGVAVTGSVNQLGQVQPIGGLNEKIEGFFTICQHQGLTGEQGVLIPAINKADLMLQDEVIEAVTAGQFHIWAIETIEEGMELLTGVKSEPADDEGDYPEGSLHALVMLGLDRLELDEDEEDGDEDEDGEEGGGDAKRD